MIYTCFIEEAIIGEFVLWGRALLQTSGGDVPLQTRLLVMMMMMMKLTLILTFHRQAEFQSRWL